MANVDDVAAAISQKTSKQLPGSRWRMAGRARTKCATTPGNWQTSNRRSPMQWRVPHWQAWTWMTGRPYSSQ
jgi:hypothetical protein